MQILQPYIASLLSALIITLNVVAFELLLQVSGGHEMDLITFGDTKFNQTMNSIIT